MYLAGDKTFGSMATGTIMVVAVSVIGSVTVLPALLSRLGDKVIARPRAVHRSPPRPRRVARACPAGSWTACCGGPVVAVVLSGGLLLALAIPAFGLHTAEPGLQGLPHKLAIVRTLDRIQTAFPGGPTPAHVVVSGRNVDSPQVRGAIAKLERQGLASGQVKQPITVDVNRARDVAVVSLPLGGQGHELRLPARALDAARRRNPAHRGRRARRARGRDPGRRRAQRTSTIR